MAKNLGRVVEYSVCVRVYVRMYVWRESQAHVVLILAVATYTYFTYNYFVLITCFTFLVQFNASFK